MPAASILQAVKLSLRISSTIYDSEIIELIDACKSDLSAAGVRNISDTDHLTRQAIKLYCRANFANGDTAERAMYQDRYDRAKGTMSINHIYRGSES